ncbi:MAG: type II toxin-antitoxin system RelE/ParE family toxin [Alphaproteobacteria bacterium]|jgi:hypothetical protein|nr:type II toxin-antitoxin system RelE/ParE family toxin [Alphaproteobacteria bacterium]
MRVIRHPLVARDLVAMVDHVIEVTNGDLGAASRRLDEIDALVEDIAANPISGVRLAPPMEGWLVRHGGRGHRLTVVFRHDSEANCLLIALVAFGGQDWLVTGKARRSEFE